MSSDLSRVVRETLGLEPRYFITDRTFKLPEGLVPRSNEVTVKDILKPKSLRRGGNGSNFRTKEHRVPAAAKGTVQAASQRYKAAGTQGQCHTGCTTYFHASILHASE